MEDFNFEKHKSLEARNFINHIEGMSMRGDNDNSNQKGESNLGENGYYTIIFFFSRKVTFTFKFQENLVFIFTSLFLKGHN